MANTSMLYCHAYISLFSSRVYIRLSRGHRCQLCWSVTVFNGFATFFYSFLNSFRLRLQSHFLLRFSGWHFGSALFVQVSAKQLCTNSMNHSSSHRPSGARCCAVCIAVLDEDYYTKESNTGCFSLFIAFFLFSHL